MFKWIRGFTAGVILTINILMMFIISILWEIRKELHKSENTRVRYSSYGYRKSGEKEDEKE